MASIWLRRFLGADRVQVEYKWGHNGHEVGTIAAMCLSLMPVALWMWLKDLVVQGLDWLQIKSRLCLGKETLHCLGNTLSSITEIPETLHIAQKDVYNLIQECLHKLAILDPKDGHQSLQKWKVKLEEKGYWVYYKPVSCQAEGENHYVFGFVSPWQREVRIIASPSQAEPRADHPEQLLWTYNKITCFDSTHNTCFLKVGCESKKDKKAFLYSVVIKNLETGAGAPRAFMITPSEAQLS
jgi:hypothetical protein